MLKLSYKSIIGVMGLFLVCVFLGNIVQQIYQDYETQRIKRQIYNDKLVKAGIGTTPEDIETYIQSTLKPDMLVNDALQKLQILGLVTPDREIKTMECFRVLIWLEQFPGDTQIGIMYFNTPPIYQTNICYAQGVITSADKLERIDNR